MIVKIAITLSILILLAISAVLLAKTFGNPFIHMTKMPGESYKGSFKPLTPHETSIKKALYQHVEHLSVKIGPRHIARPAALAEAAEYIKSSLRSYGFEPSVQSYQLEGIASENIIVEIKGSEKPEEIIIVGAHYDSVMPDSPGANDNASGAAAVLALAEMMSKIHYIRTVRFVFFVNEEPPYFRSKKMGSYHYAQALKKRHENVKAMMSIETIGYYVDDRNTQGYPFPLSFFYPSTGNFIAFVGNLASRPLVLQATKVFRESTDFPAEGGALPFFLPGVDWSDQWSFWKFGYPAIMVTDTALFRYPYYHTEEDTIDKMHFKQMARVVGGLENVILSFVNK